MHYFVLILLLFYIIAYTTLNKLFAVFFTYNNRIENSYIN